MDPQLPKPDYSWGMEWDWPWRKFNLDPEDLFTTLHDRFNTRKLPVQDPESFHRDVIECITISDTVDDFYSNLEQRKAQRMEEIDSAWTSVKRTISLHSEVLGCKRCYDPENPEQEMSPGSKNDSTHQRWLAFSDFYLTMSLDSLVQFFDGYTRDQREEDDKRHQRRAEKLQRLLNRKRRLNSATASLTADQADLAPTQVPPLEPVQPPPHDELGVQNPPHDVPTSETCSASLKHLDQPQPTLPSSHPGSQATENSLSKKRKMASSEDNTEERTTPVQKKPRVVTPGGESSLNDLKAIQAMHAESIASIQSETCETEESCHTDCLEPRSDKARTDDAFTRCSPDRSLLLPQESLGSDAGENGTTPPSSIQMGHSAPNRVKSVSSLQIGNRDDKTLREEQSISPKQSQPKSIGQGQPLKEKSPPLTEEFLRSKQASRRNPGQELSYLGDDATACSAEDTIQGE